MNAQEFVLFALKASIFLTVFGFGLLATGEDLLYVWRKPGLLGRSLVAMFVIMPLVAVFLVKQFAYQQAVDIALVALAISPVPPLLPRRVTQSGGRTPFGLGMMVTAAVLSIVFIPLALRIVGQFADKPFTMTPGAVARLIGMSVLLPVAAGMLLRKVSPQFAARIVKPVSRFAIVLLLLSVLPVLVKVFPVAWSLIGDGTIIGIMAFIVAGLIVGHLLGGPNPDERVTLALLTACRHPALALAIAAANFPDQKRVVGAIVLYLLLNMLLAIPYVSWQRRVRARASDAGHRPTKLAA
jgi:BASS family bile acid:Na+ symporter